MIKKFHIGVKIFFTNPYVVQVDHNRVSYLDTMAFTRLTWKLQKTIAGTWGYSRPAMEMVSYENVDYDNTEIFRSFWCFADEMDALQFRLAVDMPTTHVFMWPQHREFNIFEISLDE